MVAVLYPANAVWALSCVPSCGENNTKTLYTILIQ